MRTVCLRTGGEGVVELVEIIAKVGVAVLVHVLVGGEVAQDEAEVVLIHKQRHQQDHRVVEEVDPQHWRLRIDGQEVLCRRQDALPHVEETAEGERAKVNVVGPTDAVANVRAEVVEHRNALLGNGAVLGA